jgi:hypothetical protein
MGKYLPFTAVVHAPPLSLLLSLHKFSLPPCLIKGQSKVLTMGEGGHFYFDRFHLLLGGALPFFYLHPSMAPTDYRDLGTCAYLAHL